MEGRARPFKERHWPGEAPILEQEYGAAEYEHDVGRVLAGELPERCSNWSEFEFADIRM